MKISDAIKQKRTIRMYTQEKIDYPILQDCVDCARLSSSARNSQPLEYVIVDDQDVIKRLLPSMRFGGLISEDRKPRKGYEPAALIIVLVKKGDENYYKYDVGIAAQNISLAAYEHNIGTCMLGSINRDELKKELNVPQEYNLDLVISLGYPAEHPVIEETKEEPKYYRENDVLHVTKRNLENILHRNKFRILFS